MSAAPVSSAPPPLFDLTCDAEQLRGLIAAFDLVVESIEDHPTSAVHRQIGVRDVLALDALLRSAEQVLDRLEKGLGALS